MHLGKVCCEWSEIETTVWLEVGSWEVISGFIHAWGTKGAVQSYPEFFYIVSSGDVKHFIYWTLTSQFQINQLSNFLLGVCANDCVSLPLFFNTFRELDVKVSFGAK